MSDGTNDLIFEASRGQAQFAYFQLGLAASAIAFAVHETDGKALADTPWPLGLAVAMWALSFALGCFGVIARHQGLATNARFNMATRGAQMVHNMPELQAALDEAKNKTQRALDKPFGRFQGQLWLLFAGAMAYVAGHIMQMAATPSAHPATHVAPTNHEAPPTPHSEAHPPA
jgi:hypothetical protein